MKIILAIGAGSFLGGIARHLLSVIFYRQIENLPVGTLVTNVTGCLLIGVFFSLIEKGIISNNWYPFIITGVLGGFTTFSAFSLETVNLIKQGLFLPAVLNVGLSIFAGLAATAIGFFIFKLF